MDGTALGDADAPPDRPGWGVRLTDTPAPFLPPSPRRPPPLRGARTGRRGPAPSGASYPRGGALPRKGRSFPDRQSERRLPFARANQLPGNAHLNPVPRSCHHPV